MESHEFGVKKECGPEANNHKVFSIDWFKLRLNVLETFDEGEFLLAN